jgi:hypothetical protein
VTKDDWEGYCRLAYGQGDAAECKEDQEDG